MWFKTLMTGLFSAKKGDGIGGLATDIREAIKGKEIDPDKLIDTYVKLAEFQSKTLQTEMSGNWLQRSWRPLLMLSLVFVVVNNYILQPYFPSIFIVTELPDHLWELLKIGVGGYIVGRSVEKAADKWKK